MFAKIRHVAIHTENYERMARFYQTIFGMKRITTGMTDESGNYNPNRGHISDGLIGYALLQRQPGFKAGLDHFGFEVEDIRAVKDRLGKHYPELMVVKSLEHVPFAVMRAQDPAGTQFDVSQKGAAKVREGYTEKGWEQPRHLNHIAIRAAKPALVAEFYQSVFELRALGELSGNGAFCLGDEKVCLVIRPCENTSYRGITEGLDHIGFKVESLEKVKEDLEGIGRSFPQSAPRKIDVGRFGRGTLEDLQSCVIGAYPASDPDGVLLDFSE